MKELQEKDRERETQNYKEPPGSVLEAQSLQASVLTALSLQSPVLTARSLQGPVLATQASSC